MDFRSVGIPVSQGFSSLGELHVHAEGDTNAICESTTKEEQPVAGPSLSATPSMPLGYRFGRGWKFIRGTAKESTITSLHPDPSVVEFWPRQFAIWLHGDSKGCQARIRFTDSTGQTFQPDGPKIDWTGWRYVTFPMQSTEDKPLAYWGGANDGVIHYPIKWDTLFLLDNISRQPIEGKIYLSAPTLIY